MASLLVLNVNALVLYESKGGNLILLSFFIALARCIEVFLKPVVAFNSDKATFKLGRRKPFMLFAAPFYAVFLVLIFSPPEFLKGTQISMWFGAFYILFFVAETVSLVPYFALGPGKLNLFFW